MRQYRNYTDQDIINKSKEVYSMGALLKSLGLFSGGGNFANMKRQLKRLNLTCDHWKGQGWNKGEQLKEWGKYVRPKTLKPHLIKERGHRCESCGRTNWMDYLIPLELEHVEGNRTNNHKNNLKLLCCNCHALTPTWRRNKNSRREIRTLTPEGNRA